MRGSLFLCVLLAGCAAYQTASEYGHAPREQVTVAGKSYIIQWHPADKTRLYVTDTIGRAAGKSLAWLATLSMADMNGAARGYEEAALKYLSDKGKKCEVVRSSLVPDAGYEVTVRCAEIVRP